MNNSPLSNFSDSENEEDEEENENDSVLQAIKLNDALPNSSVSKNNSEITESMRKAFDIMLQKNVPKLNSPTSFRRGNITSGLVTECGSVFTQSQSHDSQPGNAFASKNVCIQRLSPCASAASLGHETQSIPALPFHTTCSDGVPSVLESRTQRSTGRKFPAQTEDSDFVFPADLPNAQGAKFPTDDTNSNNLNEEVEMSQTIQHQFWGSFPIESEPDQWPSPFNAPQIYSEESSSPESPTNSADSEGDPFQSQTNFVPMAIDQINPSIDFLPANNDDFSYYANSLSPLPENLILEQPNPSFNHQPSEPCWVLAQLN